MSLLAVTAIDPGSCHVMEMSMFGGKWRTLIVSREGGGSATAIKEEGVTISCSSHSDRIALFR